MLLYIERWLKAPVQMEDGNVARRFASDSLLEGDGFELLVLTISGQLLNDTADLLVDTCDKTRDKTLHLSGGFRWQDQR